MNETYWVVVRPDGEVRTSTMRLTRRHTLRLYAQFWCGGPPHRRREWWRKQYRKGARCIKVRLVPVGLSDD